jgi:hypothetical protein
MNETQGYGMVESLFLWNQLFWKTDPFQPLFGFLGLTVEVGVNGLHFRINLHFNKGKCILFAAIF